VRTLIEKLKSNNHPQINKIANADDVYLSIAISDVIVECKPPTLSLEESLTFKDIFTTCSPRITLNYIQLVILQLGGTADLNFQTCFIAANLATHNFPAAVCISIRIFYVAKYDCSVVRFNRISGDTLHFISVLRKLMQECCSVLTGLPEKLFPITQEEKNFATMILHSENDNNFYDNKKTIKDKQNLDVHSSMNKVNDNINDIYVDNHDNENENNINLNNIQDNKHNNKKLDNFDYNEFSEFY